MFAVRTLVSLLALFLVAACAGYDPEYDPLERWVGKTERDLVMAGGAPDTVHEMSNGNRVLTWRYESVEQHGGELYTITETHVVDGEKVVVPVIRQRPAQTIRLECTTSFEINPSGYILDYSSRGNACGDFPQ